MARTSARNVPMDTIPIKTNFNVCLVLFYVNNAPMDILELVRSVSKKLTFLIKCVCLTNIYLILRNNSILLHRLIT